MVNTLVTMKRWDPAELAAEQRNDPDLAVMYQAKSEGRLMPTGAEVSGLSEAAKTYLHDWKRTRVLPSGVMYRLWESADGEETVQQVLLPLKYQEKMYRNAHEAPTAGHMGRRRTQAKLQKKYFWYRMGEDIKLWIQTCEKCQMRKRGCKAARAPLVSVVSGNPNERVAMDVIDHLKPSTRGNVCILTITDYFTKFVIAEPLPDQKAHTLADAFMRSWVRYFGAPQQLHTDQGKSIDGNLIRQLCSMLNIEKTRTTPYHPQGDGQVERYNQTLMNTLHALASVDADNWDNHIDNAVSAYNSTRHSVTGYEPNKLMLSRNVHMPSDLMIPDDPDVQPQFTNEYVLQKAKSMRFIYTMVRARLKRAATATKRYYDRKAKYYAYKEGDAVKIRKFRLNKGTKKFDDHYEGPYYVIDLVGLTHFRLAKNREQKPRVLHHDSLLPYHKREDDTAELDNAWVFEVSHSYNSKRLVDAEVQTEHWQPPEHLPATGDDDVEESMMDIPALPESDILEAATETTSTELTGDTQPIRHGKAVTVTCPEPHSAPFTTTRYTLRKREVPRTITPRAPSMELEQQPRKRGRPRKVKPEELAAISSQTEVQIAVRWLDG